MSSLRCQISISLDGFVAGPNQSVADPIGAGGMRLHEWVFATAIWRRQSGLTGGEQGADGEVLDEAVDGVGAYVMGRNMFGGGPGPWDETWTGWWGEDPPYHVPVFVLTHHAREPLTMQGGTTFTFVTDGIESALARARTAAGEKDIAIAGGADTVQQYLAADLLDELYLHIVPIVLGAGERLLENVGDPTLEPVKVIASPAVTHVKYRVVREGGRRPKSDFRPNRLLNDPTEGSKNSTGCSPAGSWGTTHGAKMRPRVGR
jgi:dihydrofolate reductase